MEEFFCQGDQEARVGLPISPFCDRHKDTDIPKSQQGFLKFVCRPFYAAAARVMPGPFAQAAVDRLDANLSQWATWKCSKKPSSYLR